MQIDQIQSGVAAFEPRARLLKLIGAELISDDIVALTELVKNAHDADASTVTIQFVGVTGDQGEILVRDDGHGMDLATLMSRWMQPAGSAKGREGRRFSRGGRRVLGEKGVGRFAADKLAAHLELVSRPSDASAEIHAVFDWDQFECDDRMLSEIHSRWEVRPPDWLESQGTVLRLTRLRARWNERLFRRLSTRLSRLISPFGTGAKGFSICIESDEFPDYSGEVSTGFLDAAPYTLEAEFDGEAAITLQLNGGPRLTQPWSARSPPTCGPVRARIFAFDLEADALARIGPRTEVRAWLREWSGISVYRDGFRIWPYGEPHDDWLRLDQRRVNNPVVRLSNNQVVGFIEISADHNPHLRDQTNREGLIHNAAFDDLQRLVLHVMLVIEAERQSKRHPGGNKPERRTGKSAAGELDGLTETLERLARKADGPLSDELLRATERVRIQIESRELVHRRTLDGYSDLAAIGHTASLLGRSVNASLADMRARVSLLRSSIDRRRGADPVELVTRVDELEATLDSVTGQLALVSAAGSGTARRRRGIEIPAELFRLRVSLRPVLVQEEASLEIEAPEEGVLRTEMRPETFASVMNVLVRNALEWRVPDRALKMNVVLREADDALEIQFSDNGRGVLASLENKLFEPEISGHNAAGMGLTIARNVITAHGGSIVLVIDRRRKGATFRIHLPRKRSRATSPRTA